MKTPEELARPRVSTRHASVTLELNHPEDVDSLVETLDTCLPGLSRLPYDVTKGLIDDLGAAREAIWPAG